MSMRIIKSSAAAISLLSMMAITFEPTAIAVTSKQAYPKSNPASRQAIMDIVIEEALSNRNVPVELALAVARVESNFNANARSHVGAVGVMQIMPATGKGEFGVNEETLYVGRTNVRLGILYLNRLYDMYGQDWDAALSHYNGGTLKRDSNSKPIPHGYTADYVALVKEHWEAYSNDQNIASLVEQKNKQEPNIELAGGPNKPLALAPPSVEPKSKMKSQKVEISPTAGETLVHESEDIFSELQTENTIHAENSSENDLRSAPGANSQALRPSKPKIIAAPIAQSLDNDFTEIDETIKVISNAEEDTSQPTNTEIVLEEQLNQSVAVTGEARGISLAEDIREARLSFREVLQRHEQRLNK